MNENITAQCIHCQRIVVLDSRDGWVDPEATGDDVMWRETCDAHDTFTAEHEVATGAGETVTTWADGFGRWHARVNFPGGYGPAYLDAHIDRIRAKARRAIRREILARQPGPIAVGFELVASDLDHMNVMHSLTYAEKV